MSPDPTAAAVAILRAERDHLEAECTRLAARVEELKAFEGEYRARLDAYLTDLRTTLRMEGHL